MPMEGCPGAANIKGTPTLKEKICPNCGAVIEMFSVDMQVECKCGFVAYNDVQNCISWCKYARECVGDEVYEKFCIDKVTAEPYNNDSFKK